MWHPRATGETAYPIEETLERMAQSLNPPWLNVTLASGFTYEDEDLRPKYRLVNGKAEFKGRCQYSSATIPTNTSVGTTVGITRPYSGVSPCVTTATSTGGVLLVGLAVNTVGELILRSTGNQWVQLDGLAFPIDT